ncbi:HC-toxin synthetase [Pochonia chlamydosporia 170]|uniref:HC-toxin synthetase n=1 Tax=Pochonia chlamydosporia 170 TaxID=1380566 RepID=A0A179F8A1_METCM|nr:HC-toxin synthetase [Pochonia chlamydosporia 170]OAQ61656.2 HC-toxin synthetase [Pochonia chlamydosporia 170]
MVAPEDTSVEVTKGNSKVQPLRITRMKSTGLPSAASAIQTHIAGDILDNKTRVKGDEVSLSDRMKNGHGCGQPDFAQKWYARERQRILLQNPHLARTNFSVALEIRGPFQEQALQVALDLMVKRHEILKTTFSLRDDNKTAIVHSSKVKNLKVVDFLHDDEASLVRVLEQNEAESFDLENETPWRVSLYRLNEERHILFIVMHCIVADYRSPRILVRELSSLYSVSGQKQYAVQVESVSLQPRRHPNLELTDRELQDCQDRLYSLVNELQGVRPLELPPDRPRPAVLSGRFGKQSVQLDPTLYCELQNFCAKTNADLSATLLAAFIAAHYRLTGADDTLLGVLVEIDRPKEFSNTIGFVENLQLLRSAVEDKSFVELVGHVHNSFFVSNSSQDIPFELIAAELQKTTQVFAPSHHPLVQTALFLHSETDPNDYSFEGTSTHVIDYPVSSRFDVELHFHQGEEARCELLFSTDLFVPETICNLLSIFQTTLEQAVKNPNLAIASLPLLTDKEFNRLMDLDLIRVNESEYPRECSIVDIFRQQVANCADAVAVKDSTTELTYSQLDHQSDVLSWWLSCKGFAPETIITVLAIRSCETIVALLGILKANMAYLPLDANQPDDRIEKILLSMESPRLVLCSQSIRRPTLKQIDAEFVCITDVFRHSATKVVQLVSPSATSLAYVMFTSGSTGKPKGVMIEHRAIVRLVKNSNGVEYMAVHSNTAHMANIAFDASTWEIYAALLNGGTIICIDALTVLHHRTVEDTFVRQKIHNAIFTTALFKEYLVGCPGLFRDLRAVYVGAEKVNPKDFNAAQKLIHGNLYHVYGPTENTSFSTIYLSSKTETYTNTVPLGAPVSNSGAYVMDSQLRLLPLGVIGELVVTGDGLARGYTDSHLDQGRFVSIDINGKSIRAYRTGDFVRRRPADGQLEFIGRIDGQLKIRGHRLELEEVEQVLRSWGPVKDAVVLVSKVKEDKQSDLIGFVTLGETNSPSGDDEQDPTFEDDQVGGWGDLFNADKYLILDDTEKSKLGRDFTAWTSMYDGQNIDPVEMNEWLDDTIATIRDGGQPGDVLEIGSGSGMILFNMAEGLTSYIGLDPAQRAVDFVNAMIPTIPGLVDKVRVELGTATDTRKLREFKFPNLVIINSVAQYFPSLDYLSSVVEDLLNLDGTERLFFGDIRSFALYREFQVSTALHRMGNSASASEVLGQMAQVERSEEELLIDPSFFTALADRYPDSVEHVEIIPKRMKATNELSCYRYSAVVHLKQQGRQVQIRDVPEADWIDFMAQELDYQLLLKILQSHSRDSSAIIAVSNIPHSKTILERWAVDVLDGGNASELQDNWYSLASEKAKSCPSLSAIDLVELSKISGFRVEISWARQRSQRGGLDAIFHRFHPVGCHSRLQLRFPSENHRHVLESLGTQPLWLRQSRKVEHDLRKYIRSQLPSYMVPKIIRAIKKIPVNNNGKIDRQALGKRIKTAELSKSDNIEAPPRNELDRAICEEFLRVLGVSVGIHDDFFEHGGHSLNATRATSGINTRLSANITVKDIFDCPTVAALSERIKTSTDSRRYVPIPRNDANGPIEQSYAQRRLWFLEQLYPGSTWYLMPFAVRLRGSLNCDALVAALCALEKRHESLRTTFEQQNGVGLQIVHPFQPKTLDIIDVPAENGEEAIRKALHQEHTKPFDLENEAGWRVKLYRRNGKDFVLSIVMHHIISDGWSVDILQRELAEFYSTACQAENLLSEVKQLSIRYQDYATWQKGQGQIEEHQRQLAYWVKHLDGSRPAELFCDRRRPASLSGKAATQEFKIPSSLHDKLVKFCNARRHITPFIVLLAAFRATHYRLTGSADATIGIPIANRNREELEDIIGFFVNIQCMRIRIENESFEELVQSVQSTATSAFANQDVPFESIVSRLQTHRDASRNPLVQMVFALHSQLDLGQFRLTGLESEQMSLSVTSRFDLECHIFQEKQSLRGNIVYSTDLYEPPTIENLTRTFYDLLERGLCEPEIKLVDLPLLTPESQTKLEQLGVLEMNRCSHTRNSTVVDVFRQQVAAHPDKIAVKDSTKALTYSDLDKQSDRLRDWLTQKEMAVESLVGVYATRSCRTIVTFLGILKAHLGYLPLDIKLPPARIENILSALEGELLILAGDDLVLPTIQRQDVHFVRVSDILDDELLDKDMFSRCSIPTTSSVAYVMFTSGSTGKPKGVVVEHRGIVRLATQQTDVMKHLDPKKNMAHVSNIAFDASTWEIYTALLNGGTLICVDDLASLDANALTDIFIKEHVQNALFTPLLLKEFVQHPRLLQEMHTVCTGGELCDPAVFNAALALVSGTVIHCYGPTEDTCISSVYCPEGEVITDRVPIGRSISNSWAYIMDSNLQVVPIGVVGELVIAGDGLARGYTNPQLNTNRFVSVTVCGRQIRAYRTGDYARYRPVDGQLDFLGRIDVQVKIRGHRVEVAEIEQALQNHSRVGGAVVVSQHEKDGSSRLSAFVATKEIEVRIDTRPLIDHEAEVSQLQISQLHDELFAMLRASLPSYMIPTSIQILNKLPINENGKIDRRVLANTVVNPVVSDSSKRQPTLAIERKMQNIWSNVLKMDPKLIGVDDNFFWIGGDSISAMKVVAAAREDGLSISVGDIFSDSRLSQVSQKAVPLLGSSSEYIAPFTLVCGSQDIPSLVEGISSQCHGGAHVQDAFPCTPLQEGFMSLSSKQQGGYVMQAVMKLSPSVLISAFCGAWEKVFRVYPILRTRIASHNQFGLLQVVLDEDIEWIDANKPDEYIQSDRAKPMGIGEPLSRFALVKDDVGLQRWFVLTMHHALYDGWSMSLILDAVDRAYREQPLNTPPQFQLFIQHVLSQQSTEGEDYWRKVMEGYRSVPFPTLPLSVKQQPLADQALTYQFARLGDQNTDITIATILRGAWALVAGHMTNCSDVVFGATVFGRNAPIPDIDRMPAPTIATVPVRVKFAGSQKVSEYLKSVQQDSSKMISFEQMGLHRIAKISTETRQACSFQTLLVIQPQSHTSEPNSLGTWENEDQDRFFNSHSLVLDMEIKAETISIIVNFDSSVIERWVVHALLVRLEHVVQQLQSSPETTLDDIQVTSPRDLTQLWQWNAAVPKTIKRCIHNMIEENVKDRPHAQAVCAWDGELTYAELDKLSTILSQRLSSLRVGPEVTVPLCFEKSRWTVVGMMAVLKAGGAFVLLEPSQPISRLRSIMDQIRSPLVVSSVIQAPLCANLAELILPIGPSYFLNIPEARPFHPAVTPLPSSAMYIVFTSGSTGSPKGVIITHEAFCSAVTHQSGLFGYSKTTRAFDFSSYMFDVCLLNTFTTLAVGGFSMKADFVDLTPSVARTLHRERLGNLKTVVLGGEVVRSDDVAGWPTDVRVITSYGPAECTPSTTINLHSLEQGGKISIGFGAGAVTWVTNVADHNKLAPLGTVGELLLEGPIVGDGYLNNPDRTQAAFIKDPEWLLNGWEGNPGRRGRLYKTGDLVRYNEDGSLVFVGRKDTQVKIRGQRVELGDVEHHIQQCMPDMSQVVVEAISVEAGSTPNLIAFIAMDARDNTMVNGDGGHSAIRSIDIGNDTRSKLTEKLPSYMIPVAFLNLSSMPSTASGKANRRRLQEIGRSFLAGEIEALKADSLECGDKANGAEIGENEELAYKLAKKIFSLIPAWNQNGHPRTARKPQSSASAYDDVMLHSAGLDSVNMMSIMAFIMYEFEVRIRMQDLMDPSTTIRRLAQLVSEAQVITQNGHLEESSTDSTESLDLIAEVDRHDARIAASQALTKSHVSGINGLHVVEATRPLRVFLTGSNGFIGLEILRQLLEHRQIGQVTALVRGKSSETAKNRLVSAAKKALWWTSLHDAKLQVWSGDLSLPKLGLGSLRWNSLKNGSAADVIIHNGADVHFSKPYTMLEATNVLSTLELLDMAVTSQNMRFVYVGGGLHTSQSKTEDEVLRDLSGTDSNGYAQTKFVAEALVKRAAARSLPGTNHLSIVRLGLVIGTSTEGFTNSNDYIWRLTASCIRVGAYNAAESDIWVPVSDVAATAMRIISTALDTTSEMDPVIQLHDGMKFGEFWAILKAMGYTLVPKSLKEWLAMIRKDIKACGETHPLWPLAHALESNVTWVPEDDSDVEVKCRDTPFKLKVAVWRSVEYLKKDGFLRASSLRMLNNI